MLKGWKTVTKEERSVRFRDNPPLDITNKLTAIFKEICLEIIQYLVKITFKYVSVPHDNGVKITVRLARPGKY